MLLPSSLIYFFSLLPPPPTSTLFPYTTLFRSRIGVDTVGSIKPNFLARSFLIAAKQPGNALDLFGGLAGLLRDRKSTRLNSSHGYISYAVFCLKKKKKIHIIRKYVNNSIN